MQYNSVLKQNKPWPNEIHSRNAELVEYNSQIILKKKILDTQKHSM